MFYRQRLLLHVLYIFLWWLGTSFYYIHAYSNDDEEESHFLYDEDAAPVQDYHGV
jgi:hypothetical protein